MKRVNKRIVALLCALATCAAMVFYFDKKERDYEKRFEMGSVLVLKRYVPSGRVLEKGDLEEKSIPLAYQEPGAMQQWPHEKIKARIGLLPGEQLTSSKVIDEKSQVGLAWKLNEGMGAISVLLSAEQGLAPMLHVGDHVAVMGRDPAMKMVLNQAQVLALHRSQERDELQGILVTLAVPVESAGALARARDNGPLHLMLWPGL
jgi:Flp pilus assembly protein CpaB